MYTYFGNTQKNLSIFLVIFFTIFETMSKKRKVGRPKMAEKDKKVGFSLKVKPDLWKRIQPLKNRNAQIEVVLEKNF